MNRLLIISTLVLSTLMGLAQTKKPKKEDTKNLRAGVLVVGQENASVAAALQAAISGVKTILITKESNFTIVPERNRQPGGIEALFLQKMRDFKGIKDSSEQIPIDLMSANSVLTTWMDSTKNLTVIKNANWEKFERSGAGWYLRLNDGRTIRASVLVNGLKEDIGKDMPFSTFSVATLLDYNNNNYRTSVAGNNRENGATISSLYNFLKPGQENIVFANSSDADMAIGQAAGAIGAYAAFFNTKTSASDLKRIQGELLHYRQSLIPFADVKPKDTNWRAIQHVGLMGVLRAEVRNGSNLFMPDKEVSYAEIKQPIKDLYYKAQLWFDDHHNVPINLENVIAMVSYVGNKSPQATQSEIEKRWVAQYQFSRPFDLKRVLTRREFAAVINDYIRPFDVRADKDGRIVR